MGHYLYGGRNFDCHDDQSCLLLYDNGRGIFDYHTNWIWAALETKAEDKNGFNLIFGLNLGDGIGINS